MLAWGPQSPDTSSAEVRTQLGTDACGFPAAAAAAAAVAPDASALGRGICQLIFNPHSDPS